MLKQLEKFDFDDLKNRYDAVKKNFRLLIVIIIVLIIMILILNFSKTEIVIDIYEGNIYLSESKFWGIVKTEREIRYFKDSWNIKTDDGWNAYCFKDE